MAAAWHPDDDQSEARGGYEQWGLGDALSYFSIGTELWGISGTLGTGDWGSFESYSLRERLIYYG